MISYTLVYTNKPHFLYFERTLLASSFTRPRAQYRVPHMLPQLLVRQLIDPLIWGSDTVAAVRLYKHPPG